MTADLSFSPEHTNLQSFGPRPQFSLRKLLLVLTICTFPAAWYGCELEARRREQASAAWVEQHGGEVRYAEGSFRRVVFVSLRGPLEDSPTDLQPLAAFTSLQRLELVDVELAGVAALPEFKHLRKLYLTPRPYMTTRDMRALEERCPNCEFRWRDPEFDY